MRHRLALIAVLFAAFVGGVPSAVAQGGDNTAVAINTKDGSSIFRFAFAVRHVMQDTVDQSNAAVAYASCTSCTTVAIAVEVVLIEDNASTITPANIAIAINQQCTLCTTFASAYQFILTTGGTVHFTAEGNRAIEEIRKEIQDLQDQTLTVGELNTRLNALMQRLADVINTQLVPAGNAAAATPGGGGPQPATTQSTSTATPTEPTSTVSTTTPTTTETTPTTTTGTTTTTTP